MRALVALVAALVLLPAAGASASGVAEKTLSEDPASVRAYWTPERMAAARPAEELLRGIGPQSGPAFAPREERGEPFAVPSTPPAGRAGALDDLLGAGGGQSRKAQPVGDSRRFPARTHGKVFFTLNFLDYVCSANTVNSRHRKLVVTAGHCVYGDGEFAERWMFVPGHRGSQPRRPFGTWTALRLATTRQWRQNEDLRYDVGTAVMRKRDGKRLQRVVGARGIAFNRARNKTYSVHGYPTEGEYEPGHTQYVCNSPTLGADQSFSSPKPIRIACDQTAGSSGGGWVFGRGLVNSVVSYGYDCPGVGGVVVFPCENPHEGKLFGPYFGETIKRLYRSQRGAKRRRR